MSYCLRCARKRQLISSVAAAYLSLPLACKSSGKRFLGLVCLLKLSNSKLWGKGAEIVSYSIQDAFLSVFTPYIPLKQIKVDGYHSSENEEFFNISLLFMFKGSLLSCLPCCGIGMSLNSPQILPEAWSLTLGWLLHSAWVVCRDENYPVCLFWWDLYLFCSR